MVYSHEENYYRAVEFRSPQYIPTRVKLMPATWRKYRAELEKLVLRHPDLWPDFTAGSLNYDATTYRAGRYTDDWGCVWDNKDDGLEGIVVQSPLTNWTELENYHEPRTEPVLNHGFMFLRLTFIRGYENLMIDFLEQPDQVHRLIEIVLRYNEAAVKQALAENPRLIAFGEDLGMQDRLLMSPAHFRKFIMPAYHRLFQMARTAGAHVYLHSDGRIVSIAQDLLACGLTVINPQAGANGLPDIKNCFKGKACIDLDLDRQKFPFLCHAEIEEHVEEVVRQLGSKEGGLMLLAEIEPDVPLDNIEAICCVLEKYMHYQF